jgi:hypothetical protein
MGAKGFELVVLAVASASSCWTALYLGHEIAAAVFAACSSGVMVVALRHLHDRSTSPKRFDGTNGHQQRSLDQVKMTRCPPQ